MDIISILELVPSEAWGTAFGTAGGGVVVWIVKTVRKIKSDIEERDKRLVKQTSAVVGRLMHNEIESALDNRHHTRNAQISATKAYLRDYAGNVTRSVNSAVDGMICNAGCKTRESLAALYKDSVTNTFMTDVMDYFITDVISKNGFMDRTEEQFQVWIDDVTSSAFIVFLSSMRRRFQQEQIQVRVDWIQETMDKKYMRKYVEMIMNDCREKAREHKEKRKQHKEDMENRIEAEIIATNSTAG